MRLKKNICQYANKKIKYNKIQFIVDSGWLFVFLF